MKKQNVIFEKSYSFALQIIKVYQYLKSGKKEFELSRQLFRSGTSVGANIEEAIGAQSSKDFAAKMSIAYREARESHYWIRLLRDSNILERRLAGSILNDAEELMKITGSIQKTMKSKIHNS